MEEKSLIEKISYNNGRFPKKELTEIIERKEEFIPELLHITKDITMHYEDYLDQHKFFGHLYSFYLLAQFRVRELFPILIDFLKLPSDDVDALLDDFLTEDAGRVLATLYEKEEDVTLLKGLFENKDINEYSRGQGLRALVILVLHDKLDREEILKYFEQQLKLELNANIPDSGIITDLISCSNDLYPDIIFDTIKQAFDNDLVDTWVLDLDFIQNTLDKNIDEALRDELSYGNHDFIEDTIIEMQAWASFYKDHEERWKKNEFNTLNASRKLKIPSNNKPIVNELKVGRNDPCPCGSGKKYKKCCGN